jgi:polar amino acid transport system substrate-binding protein
MLRRLSGVVGVVAAGLVLGGATPLGALPSGDDHGAALAALADVRLAIAEMLAPENQAVSGPIAYRRAAHRAINALVGMRDQLYDTASGSPGDAAGAIGHIDSLLGRPGSELWTPALEGAKVNLASAAAQLQEAVAARELGDFQRVVTGALLSLEVAVGRSSETGTLGGLEGALATTTLGIPAHARVVSACSIPTAVPAYGTISGWLVFVALPVSESQTALDADYGISHVAVVGNIVMLYTSAADQGAKLCRKGAVPSGAADPPETPALYTAEQAREGAGIYRQYCARCHGTDLQGGQAPAVAGTDFLAIATQDKWTVADLRTIIFDTMPFDNPGSLTLHQLAAALAFILASNCYPAGATPFPESPDPSFATIKIEPPPDAHPTNAKLGTCEVK